VLRTNLEFMLDAKTGGKAGVTLFTSFNPGSGKTFLAMNTAAVFALKGKRILVIDGDLRHGSASAYLGSRHKGLSDYLGKRENNLDGLIQENPDIPGFFLLPAGTIPPNPTELLAEPMFKEAIERLRGNYDYIFIDCPPIDIVADTQIIEKLADRTVFLVRGDMLPELQRMYDEHRFKNMALVLNGTDGGNSRYGYRYGYHYGYGSKSYYGK
jgi:capsular exopolysaccharide synthesis family protein